MKSFRIALSALPTCALLCLCAAVALSCADPVNGVDGIDGIDGEDGLDGRDGDGSIGNIAVDTEWLDTASPYVLERDIVVKRGVTLRVGPGVRISMNPNVTLYVDGALILDGSVAAPVRIGPEASIGSGTLRFTAASSGSALRYADIARTELVLNTATPLIRNCRISEVVVGLTLSGFSSAFVLEDCSFDNALLASRVGSTGIRIDTAASISISNCVFSSFYYDIDAYTAKDAQLSIDACSFDATYSCIDIEDSSLTVSGSNFSSDGPWLLYNWGARPQSACACWWDTADAAETDRRVCDDDEDAACGAVDLSSPLAAPVAGISGCGF